MVFIAPKQSPILRVRSNKLNDQISTNIEEPYYVPVYNYSPDNAYYNPKNRQGPDSNEDERENNADYVEHRKNDLINNSDNGFSTFGVINSLQHREDNLPIENVQRLFKGISLLRNIEEEKEKGKVYKTVSSIFPHSLETEPVLTGYNKDDKSMKSKIGDIRKILSKQQNVGYISAINAVGIKPGSDQYIRTIKEEPLEVKRYKNIGFVITDKSKKKLYFPYDDISKYNLNSFKLNGKIYKASDLARYGHNNYEKIENLPKLLKNILKIKQPKQVLYEDITSNDTEKDLQSKGDEINIYIKILEDMIKVDDGALSQYDWLGTTVDIQAALNKLFWLT